MSATEFLKEKLNELVGHFPQIKVSYEFDDIAKSHFIEILPPSVFKKDEEYSKFETKIILDFISKFPSEEIVFITKNDLLKVTDPSFVREGYLYNNKVIYWSGDLFSDDSWLFESKKIVIKPIKEKEFEIENNFNDFALAA